MKTMIKITTILLVAMVTIMTFGCGKEEVADIDIDRLCSELLEQAEFEDELSQVDDEVIKMLYGINDYAQAQVYISSGATAEEIAVFEFSDTNTATNGFQMAQNRLEEQKEDFESYIPKEIRKLDRAVVLKVGKYVVVCVSNGDTAEKIITQFLGR